MTVAAELRLRIDALSTGAAYRNYLTVRDRVLEMLDRGAADGTERPSGYWREELAGFEYMLDASPLIVDKLRHHSYHLTGLKVYDYRTGKDEYERRLREKLDALLEVGGEQLFVPERAELGGFGFRHGDGLFNVDTLKFFEAMIALDKGAVLTPLREGRERHVVWEIGAGWGGLAYTFKSLCPNSSYVIVDLPQVFLFSAVYLMTVMPDARFAFHGEGPLASLVRENDFVFVPHWAVDELDLPRLDLTLNMVSFQEMTTAQVEAYVDAAWRLGSQIPLQPQPRPVALQHRAVERGRDHRAAVLASRDPGPRHVLHRASRKVKKAKPPGTAGQAQVGRKEGQAEGGPRFGRDPEGLPSHRGLATADGMSSGPRVVLGVPTYNPGEPFVEAFESLVAQTYRDYALVIVDDSATDEAGPAVKRYAAGRSEHRLRAQHASASGWRATGGVPSHSPTSALRASSCSHGRATTTLAPSLARGARLQPRRESRRSACLPAELANRRRRGRVPRRRAIRHRRHREPAVRVSPPRSTGWPPGRWSTASTELVRWPARASSWTTSLRPAAPDGALDLRAVRAGPETLWYRRYRHEVEPTSANARRSSRSPTPFGAAALAARPRGCPHPEACPRGRGTARDRTGPRRRPVPRCTHGASLPTLVAAAAWMKRRRRRRRRTARCRARWRGGCALSASRTGRRSES